MAINENIWGAKADWGLKTENFGAMRSPTSAEDETKYPPFYTGLNGTGILYNYAEDNDYSEYFENPMESYDPSCAYIGIQGEELPQFNINAYVYKDGGGLEPRRYAKLIHYNGAVPFTFAECWFDQSTFDQYAGNIAAYLTGFDGYRLNDNTIVNNQKTFRYSPDSTAHPYNSNFNQLSAPVLNFGTKSVILVPYVTVSVSGAPIPGDLTTYSLKEFAELTQEQIDDIYILRVFCRVYVRTGIGVYEYNIPSKSYMYPQFIGNWEFDDFSVDGFSDNLALAHCVNTMNCELPVFGALVDLNYYSRIATHDYDSPIWCSHACIVLTNDKWEVSQLTTGVYSGAIYGNLKKESDNYNKATVIEMIRKAVAAYGLFWIEDPDDIDLGNVQDSDFFDSKMFVGIIDDDGITRGHYTNGLQNILSNNFQWTDVRQSTYDPYTPHPIEPENEYSGTTGGQSIGNLATLTERYVIDGTMVKALGVELWKITKDVAEYDPNELYKNYSEMINDTFLTNNPIDSIVSLQRFPMAIPHDNDTLENIYLGKVQSSAAGYKMSKVAYEYTFTRKVIAPAFGNSFLDYEPFTQFELYVPFCGTVEISPAEILNRELWVKLVVDFMTGTCIGYVYSDDLLIKTVNGTIAIQIPVTGTENATVNSQLSNAITAFKQSQISTSLTSLKSVTSPTTLLNPINAMASQATAIVDRSQKAYDLNHIPMPIHVIGSASPVGLWAVDLNCRLYCYYPTGDVINETSASVAPSLNETELTNFAHTNGIAIIDNAILSTYSSAAGSYVVCSDVDLSGVSATETEKSLIRAALQDGTYI